MRLSLGKLAAAVSRRFMGLREFCRNNFVPALAAVLFVAAGLAASDRAAPIAFTGGEVIPPVVMAGGKIQLVRYGIVERACGGRTFRNIVDPAGYVHTLRAQRTLSEDVIPRPGEVQRLVGRAFVLPAMNFPQGQTSGTAVMRSHIEYVCPWLGLDQNPAHWIRPIVVNLPDLPFTVVRPAP